MSATEDGGIQVRLVNFYVNMLPVARDLPVDEQSQAAVPRCQIVESGALDVDRPIIIVRRIPCVDVIVGTDEYNLLATSHRPDPRQVVQPRYVPPELNWLAKAFDEGAPEREARAPA